MTTVSVNIKNKYDVLIGTNILDEIGASVRNVHNCCLAAIISDSNVWPIYGQTVQASLERAGFSVINYTFPAGESNKNTAVYVDILNFLAKNHMTRSDLIIALGGGVTGDLAGFTAATYLRGIPYVQVPTSLLAMVDSSVGGKTAIDLPEGKNLAGAFHQPILVVCDMQALSTLPHHYFLDGCAEVIKYAVLYDAKLFDHLLSRKVHFDTEYVISRCVQLKQMVVTEDEYDTGARQMLNLGHTFGHTIEKVSKYTITHGFAIATGIHMAAKVGVFLGLTNPRIRMQIHDILNAFHLPASTDIDCAELAQAALNDKKRFGQTINLVIPTQIGTCTFYKAPVAELDSLFKAGK